MPITSTPIIVLTGGTNGLGRLAAVDLARHGAHLVIIARNAEKGDETRALIEKAAPGSACDIFLADLSVMDDVRRVGLEIAARYERIDVLINNAGIHAFEQRVTCDGFPEMMAVNYLAPWLLTRALRDVLVRSAHSRIVIVASGASKRHGILAIPHDLTDTTPFSALGSSPLYGKTKLLDIMFSQQLARELADTNVTVNALCPGFNTTGLGRELWFAGILEPILHFLRVGDPRRGASIIVHLAVSQELNGKTGGYYSVDKKLQTPVPPGGDVDLEKKLWGLTEGILEKWKIA
jgi:NAD(P)-dependent dehydrogenase (short-subunit alcohol dehydrogenase family)